MTSSFLSDAERLFGTQNLYEILRLTELGEKKESISQKQIKKAFFQLSLKFHPDRCEDQSQLKETTEKFQLLNKAYAVLSDSSSREIYDTTGSIDGLDMDDEDINLVEKWRRMFKKVTKDDIDAYIKRYKESGEEREDIKEAYIKYNGDMTKIMESIVGVTFEDEDRVKDIISHMINDGEVEPLELFTDEPAKKRSRRRKAAQKEAKEAEKMLDQIKAREGDKDLAALIKARDKDRQKNYESFFQDMERRYTKVKSARKK